MTTMAWIAVIASQFWLLMLVVYSRRWKREKTFLDDRIRVLEAGRMMEQAGRNVSDARLSTIRQAAAHSLSDEGSPYRSNVSREDVLRKIIELVDQGMTESYREVGHFRDTMEAMEFLNTLGPESNAYVFPHRMWDGDCYHVVYSVPESQIEQPPAGTGVRK